MDAPPNKRCPECVHINDSKVKFCGQCGYDFGRANADKWSWLHRNKKPILWATAIIPLLAWWILPAPYNPGYQVKLLVMKPSAICKDGIYSFSASRSGTCSNHGGVKKWVKPD